MASGRFNHGLGGRRLGPDVILQDGPQSETGRRILFRPGVFRRSRRDPQFRARGSHQGALLEGGDQRRPGGFRHGHAHAVGQKSIVIGDLVIRGWL
jgi:hypothetical protein